MSVIVRKGHHPHQYDILTQVISGSTMAAGTTVLPWSWDKPVYIDNLWVWARGVLSGSGLGTIIFKKIVNCGGDPVGLTADGTAMNVGDTVATPAPTVAAIYAVGNSPLGRSAMVNNTTGVPATNMGGSAVGGGSTPCFFDGFKIITNSLKTLKGASFYNITADDPNPINMISPGQHITVTLGAGTYTGVTAWGVGCRYRGKLN